MQCREWSVGGQFPGGERRRGGVISSRAAGNHNLVALRWEGTSEPKGSRRQEDKN